MAILLFVMAMSGVCGAKSHHLHLSGKVPERVEVTSKNGKLKVTKNSPHLKVVVQKRTPASVVTVEAP